ncbi:PIG-L family deacetylase [Salegentibacter sediminis]|uniref:PIG-L family deacetylase n=1 Tax=Salegentibacter sediminis TaxID=1930251 RepID=UPI0009BFD3F6|nr:PIG-L family deacetylase [Salegentibacter sediminis]
MPKILSLLLFFVLGYTQAQTPQKLNASEIHQEIKKLNFLGSVLYVGAHPDDENTRLISYFANKQNARVGYLSLTRGDGGQNLIGPELREQLGLIRTQELLAARNIDGGEQFFTRANDFGYSKNPEETLQIWNKDKVLSDVVLSIRKFKPDVIINRFDHRSPGSTHGHHTASAMLSLEAFELAARPTAYPDQLKYTSVFQPKRVFFNTSHWFYGSREAFEEADKSAMLSLDVGVYFPELGLSNSEIAALSRSQHQSQGFGSTGTRGQAKEYLELIKGDMPQADVFEGINTSWSRLEGGKEIGEILGQVESQFNFRDPSQSLPQLIEAYKLIQELKNDHWKEVKSEHIREIIVACSGLFLEAVATKPSATRGEQVPLELEAINRSSFPISLNSVELSPNNSRIPVNQSLANNQSWTEELMFRLPESVENTSPYWLKSESTNGMYKVAEPGLIGLPETPVQSLASFILNFNGTEIKIKRPVIHKFNDPVLGETYRPFLIIPELSVSFEKDVEIFEKAEPRSISVILRAGKDSLKGSLRLEAGKNWKILPEEASFKINQKGGTAIRTFEIIPPDNQDETLIKPIAKVGDREYSDKLIQIDYKHIPLQNLVIPAKVKAVRIEIEKKGEYIGYIDGAGDAVPQSLEQIGYRVEHLEPGEISSQSLKKFDAVVTGIRAYNVVEELRYKQKDLLEYVKNGGNLIVQYNTSRGLIVDNPAPYPLQISRDRVTDEKAAVNFVTRDHPVLNKPNRITKKDFKNWVQERGLYFPDQWSKEFTPVLSMNDEGEEATQGSLLVAKYGKGYFIYTGLSFFRQFPEGVPGAYRLFANMVSIGKE